MVQGSLAGKRILIVEDEWFVAEELCAAILRAGGQAIGPAASNAEAASLLASVARPHAASLDIRLLDGASYPTADALSALGVPILFVSATEPSSLPGRFARMAILTKPVPTYRVIQALAAMLDLDQATGAESR